MINKHNLNIAALASKEKSRFTLNAIHVTPRYTEVTNGHYLVRVSTPKYNLASFPELKGITPTREFTPFNLPAADAMAVRNAIPGPRQAKSLPILQNAVIGAVSDKSKTVPIAVTDLENARVHTVTKAPGNYPDSDRVFPREDPIFSIGVNATYIRDLMAQVAKFQDEKHMPKATIRFYGDDSVMQIEAEGGDDQTMVALVMPMGLDHGTKLLVELRELRQERDRLKQELDTLRASQTKKPMRKAS